jgi:hypothetical protein
MLAQSLAPGNKIEGSVFDVARVGQAVEGLMRMAEISNLGETEAAVLRSAA